LGFLPDEGQPLENYLTSMSIRSPKALPTVDWWFIIKQNGGRGFYYYDSKMDEADKKSMIFYSDGGLGVNALGLFMLTHYRVLNGRNIRSTYDEETETIINMGHEKNSHMDVKKVDLKSLGIWFNDQPSKNVPSLRNLNLEDSELKAKNYKWKFAHSKFMLALEVNEEKKFSGGYMIDHSIPQSPYGHSYKESKWKDSYPGANKYEKAGWEFFGTNGDSKAQHLSCFNFNASEVASILQNLSRTLPKPVLSTLSSGYFPRLLDSHHARLVGDFFNPDNTVKSAKTCLEKWKKERTEKDPLKLLTSIVDECTQSMNIQSGLIKLISHSPTPHAKTFPEDDNDIPTQKKSSISMDVDASTSTSDVKNTERERPMLREVHATFFGPIPWKMTANILQTQLYISTWTNVDLPTIVQKNIGIYLGDGLKVNANWENKQIYHDWDRGQSHEKIGIALRKSDDKYWTCIADGNHRTSEISHAGATICISSENLWNAVTSRLRSEEGSYLSTGAVLEDTEDVTLDITLRAETQLTYRNQFRWHISDSDPSKERKPSRVLGLSDISSSSSGSGTSSPIGMDISEEDTRRRNSGKRHGKGRNLHDIREPKKSKKREK
jgi:hypothetical protein